MISTIIVTDIYVHSLVELKIIKMHGTAIKVALNNDTLVPKMCEFVRNMNCVFMYVLLYFD